MKIWKKKYTGMVIAKLLTQGYMGDKLLTKTVVVLLLGLFAVPTSFGQTCNPNIPLKTPSSNFTDHGDGTVTHKTTRLMWKKCVEGLSGLNCDIGSPVTRPWAEALGFSEITFAGYSNWRLPNIKELASILEDACYSPMINLSIFPNDPGWLVWSSSTYAKNPDYAWRLPFSAGIDSSYSKNSRNYIRLVRNEQ